MRPALQEKLERRSRYIENLKDKAKGAREGAGDRLRAQVGRSMGTWAGQT